MTKQNVTRNKNIFKAGLNRSKGRACLPANWKRPLIQRVIAGQEDLAVNRCIRSVYFIVVQVLSLWTTPRFVIIKFTCRDVWWVHLPMDRHYVVCFWSECSALLYNVSQNLGHAFPKLFVAERMKSYLMFYITTTTCSVLPEKQTYWLS